MGKHSLIPSLNNFALMARSKITVSCSQLSKSNICYRRDTLFASDFTWSWRNSSCCRHLKLSTFNLITRLLCIPLSHITYSPEASYAHSKKQHYMQRNFRLIWSISANQSNMKVWRQREKKSSTIVVLPICKEQYFINVTYWTSLKEKINLKPNRTLTVVAFAEVIQQEASAWWWMPSES